VVSLGRTLLQDLYASAPLASSVIPTEALEESAYSFPSFKDGSNPNILLQAPTPLEIAGYFALVNPLKYSQPHQPLPSPFSPPLSGLTITAYSAGHTLGGTIWHIQHGMESVVYAVDWNQAREHVLSGAAWLGGHGPGGSEVLEQLRRPTAMICSTKGTGQDSIARQRQKRDEALIIMIRETVQNGGSVLIPSDSSARILELAYLLEETWTSETSHVDSPLKNARIYLASRTGGATMKYARNLLEWMEEGIIKRLETVTNAQKAQEQRRTRGQGASARAEDGQAAKVPFDFRYITLLERKSRVDRMLAASEPRVILASDTSLEWGFSRDAVRALAADERNLIILPERVSEKGGEDKGLGRFLWELWKERSATAGDDANSATVINLSGTQTTVLTARAAALEGGELLLYQQYLARQRQLQTTMQGDSGTALETSADAVDDRSSSTSTMSEESESGLAGRLLTTAFVLRRTQEKDDKALGIFELTQRKDVFDYDVRGKKGPEGRFPYVAKRRQVDDFGDMIRPEEFVRTEEEDHGAGEALRESGKKKQEGDKKRAEAKRKEEDEADAQDGDVEASDSEPEEDSDKVDGPSKVITHSETLELNCRLSFIDFSGLHDRRTIQMLIPMIRPRKLIFIAGNEVETNELAEECRNVLNAGSSETGTDIFTPTIGTTIDASAETNAWNVKISRSLARKLQWQEKGSYRIALVTGILEAASLEPSAKEEEQGTATKRRKLEAPIEPAEKGEPMDITPTLDVVPANITRAVRTVAQPFHVGDLKLADLRKIMQASGMTAEYRGEGVLLINGRVAFGKTPNGKIEIDGGAYRLGDQDAQDSDTFYIVKKKIYEALGVVADH
jgi:cleavage and polyadenylation specificity factor subunit 2